LRSEEKEGGKRLPASKQVPDRGEAQNIEKGVCPRGGAGQLNVVVNREENGNQTVPLEGFGKTVMQVEVRDLSANPSTDTENRGKE